MVLIGGEAWMSHELMPYEAAAALAKCVARASVSRLKSYSMVFGNPGIGQLSWSGFSGLAYIQSNG